MACLTLAIVTNRDLAGLTIEQKQDIANPSKASRNHQSYKPLLVSRPTKVVFDHQVGGLSPPTRVKPGLFHLADFIHVRSTPI